MTSELEWHDILVPASDSYNHKEARQYWLEPNSNSQYLIQPDTKWPVFEIWKWDKTGKMQGNRNRAYNLISTHDSLEAAKVAYRILRVHYE